MAKKKKLRRYIVSCIMAQDKGNKLNIANVIFDVMAKNDFEAIGKVVCCRLFEKCPDHQLMFAPIAWSIDDSEPEWNDT